MRHHYSTSWGYRELNQSVEGWKWNRWVERSVSPVFLRQSDTAIKECTLNALIFRLSSVRSLTIDRHLLGGKLVRHHVTKVRPTGQEQSELWFAGPSSKRKPELQTELWVGPAKNWTAIEPPGPKRTVWNLNLSLLLSARPLQVYWWFCMFSTSSIHITHELWNFFRSFKGFNELLKASIFGMNGSCSLIRDFRVSISEYSDFPNQIHQNASFFFQL